MGCISATKQPDTYIASPVYLQNCTVWYNRTNRRGQDHQQMQHTGTMRKVKTHNTVVQKLGNPLHDTVKKVRRRILTYLLFSTAYTTSVAAGGKRHLSSAGGICYTEIVSL